LVIPVVVTLVMFVMAIVWATLVGRGLPLSARRFTRPARPQAGGAD